MAQKLALIIGNSEYEDPTLARLKAPEVDVRTLAAALRNPQMGGFDHVTELVNQPQIIVSRAISEFFLQKKKDDLLLLYFSGHGVLDEQARLFLAVKNTERAWLKATAISATFITEDMDSCFSKRQVLILDCCQSGAFTRGTKGDAAALTKATFEGNDNGYGRVVLTATDATQFAWEGDQVIGEAENSLFTHFLLEGLTTGAADTDKDGLITLDEWYNYAFDHVTRHVTKQTPRKWVYSQEGDRLVIARNPHPPQAAPLPPELQDTLNDRRPWVREGGVHELGRLLQSANPRLAFSAREALQRVKDEEDSRDIARLAAHLLASSEALQIEQEHKPAQQDEEVKKTEQAEPELPTQLSQAPSIDETPQRNDKNHNDLIEAAVETDDVLKAKHLAGEALTVDDVQDAIQRAEQRQEKYLSEGSPLYRLLYKLLNELSANRNSEKVRLRVSYSGTKVSSWQFVNGVPYWSDVKVFLDGQFIGTGNLNNGFDLTVETVVGRHALIVRVPFEVDSLFEDLKIRRRFFLEVPPCESYEIIFHYKVAHNCGFEFYSSKAVGALDN